MNFQNSVVVEPVFSNKKYLSILPEYFQTYTVDFYIKGFINKPVISIGPGTLGQRQDEDISIASGQCIKVDDNDTDEWYKIVFTKNNAAILLNLPVNKNYYIFLAKDDENEWPELCITPQYYITDIKDSISSIDKSIYFTNENNNIKQEIIDDISIYSVCILQNID